MINIYCKCEYEKICTKSHLVPSHHWGRCPVYCSHYYAPCRMMPSSRTPPHCPCPTPSRSDRFPAAAGPASPSSSSSSHPHRRPPWSHHSWPWWPAPARFRSPIPTTAASPGSPASVGCLIASNSRTKWMRRTKRRKPSRWTNTFPCTPRRYYAHRAAWRDSWRGHCTLHSATPAQSAYNPWWFMQILCTYKVPNQIHNVHGPIQGFCGWDTAWGCRERRD